MVKIKNLPSLKELELVRGKIKQIRNRKGEFLRKVHYGCFLLCSEAGLRISEAVRFDLRNKTRKRLYRITKTKGEKERLVYAPKEVIKELKANNWKPNQTNRWNFYHFLKKIKRELNISKNVELSPHTFRRAFTTYHAESGVPLPILQKLLGHSSVRTTALYWQNVHGEDDPDDILAGKKWLEQSPKPFDKGLENREKEPPKPPNVENFPKTPKNPNSKIVKNKPTITAKKPTNQNNSLLTAEDKKNPVITNHQPQKLIGGIPPRVPKKFFLKKKQQRANFTNQN